jgi:pimeloyl-ACP methyl ester carboxylesterase
MTIRSTIFFFAFSATLCAEELPRKAKTPRESYPDVDVIYDSVTAPDGKRLRTIITKPRNAKGKLPVIFVAGWLSCDSVEAPTGTKDASGLVFQGLVRLPQFSLFRVDKQGVGDSEGVCAETDFDSELGGYRAAFRALKNYERRLCRSRTRNRHRCAATFRLAAGPRHGSSTCSRSNGDALR